MIWSRVPSQLVTGGELESCSFVLLTGGDLESCSFVLVTGGDLESCSFVLVTGVIYPIVPS